MEVKRGGDYDEIRGATALLLHSSHLSDVLAASYDRLLFDEYQGYSQIQCSISRNYFDMELE